MPYCSFTSGIFKMGSATWREDGIEPPPVALPAPMFPPAASPPALRLRWKEQQRRSSANICALGRPPSGACAANRPSAAFYCCSTPIGRAISHYCVSALTAALSSPAKTPAAISTHTSVALLISTTVPAITPWVAVPASLTVASSST